MRKTTEICSEKEMLLNKSGVIRGSGYFNDHNGEIMEIGSICKRWEIHLKMKE